MLRLAHRLACQCLPDFSCKFSRHDFTLPQLFACLVLKEHQRKSYRGVEVLLEDSAQWRADIGLAATPDHNTLWRAARFLLRKGRVEGLLDVVARWAAGTRVLGLSKKPLVIDSSMFESRHASRHYERRQERRGRQGRRGESAGGGGVGKGRRNGYEGGYKNKGGNGSRSATTRRLPKLAVAAAASCHLILSMWSGTGIGSDSPHFAPLLRQAKARVPQRRLTSAQDAGYDAEHNHVLARGLGVRSLTPASIGRPSTTGEAPSGYWRRRMKKMLATKEGRRRCGYTQRSQAETVMSMIKRNLGSALSGKTAWSRKRDLALKVLTHDLMVLLGGVET